MTTFHIVTLGLGIYTNHDDNQHNITHPNGTQHSVV